MATFSFIIPVKPGGFVAALASLRLLEETAGHTFEVFVAEGASPSRQRNAAAREATGDIIYFLDDDSMVATECLSVCAGVFENKTVAVAGGPSLTPPSDSLLQQLFGSALSSLMGAGAVRNRYRNNGTTRVTTEKELILCNLAVRRATFLLMGGFDERLYPNEENELLDRIVANGLKLMHVPCMAIQRSQRRTLRQFVRQMFSYGRGRAQQTLIAGPGTVIGFAPLIFLFYVGLLPFLPSTRFTLAPLIAYLVLTLCFSTAAAVTSGSLSRILLIPLYPLMHLSNGWGLLCGLLGGRHGRSAAGSSTPVTTRRIKEFGQSAW
jgi:succinoglycan biosynthesis protein ExoA